MVFIQHTYVHTPWFYYKETVAGQIMLESSVFYSRRRRLYKSRIFLPRDGKVDQKQYRLIPQEIKTSSCSKIRQNKMQNTVKDIGQSASVSLLLPPCCPAIFLLFSLTTGLTIPCYKFKIQASQRIAEGEWILLWLRGLGSGLIYLACIPIPSTG
jgi:hypothetical protein